MRTPSTSPLDPLFYAHHLNVDYNLFAAQMKWSQKGYRIDHSFAPLNLNDRIPGFPNVTVSDVLDVADLCIQYQQSSMDLLANDTPPATTSSTAPATATTNENHIRSTTVSIDVSSPTGSIWSQVDKDRLVPSKNTEKAKNFTLDLPDDWVNNVFKNHSSQVKSDSNKITEK